MRRLRLTLPAAIATSIVLAACAPFGSDESSEGTLTIYTDQHKELIDQLADAYTDETGVKIRVQPDATPGQIEAEEDASPADVFLSEDPGPVAQLGQSGKLTTLEDSVFDDLRDGLSSGKKFWAAYAARTRVAYYNPEQIDESEMPETLADVADPQYNDKFAWAPSGAFVATTQYLLATEGKEKTTEFLKKIKANGVNEESNGNVRDTVEAGRHAFGLSNHYYWWIKADEVGGTDKMTSKTYHFPGKDPGNLVLSSGAGVLKTSDNKGDATEFVEWLTSDDGGQAIVADTNQYPAAKGMENSVVGSLDEAQSPSYDTDLMADVGEAEHLLKKLGMSS